MWLLAWRIDEDAKRPDCRQQETMRAHASTHLLRIAERLWPIAECAANALVSARSMRAAPDLSPYPDRIGSRAASAKALLRRTVDRLCETGRNDRLEQVIDGTAFKRARGVALVRRREND